MLKVSLYELGFFLFILFILVILFLLIIYYVECIMNDIFMKFCLILEFFWWLFIIMIIVGYGDIILNMWLGKIIGGVCVVCGFFVVVFLIFIIGSNFNFYYVYV